MAAAADSEGDAALARDRDHARYVLRIRNADDGGRSAIEATVERGARLVVFGVVRSDHTAGQTGEVRDRLCTQWVYLFRKVLMIGAMWTRFAISDSPRATRRARRGAPRSATSRCAQAPRSPTSR